MENVKEETKKKPVYKKVLEIISTVIVAILFGFAILYQIMSITTKDSNFGVTNFFGMQLLVVQTDSMDPVYPVGDGLFVKKIDVSEIKVDDDISFHYEISGVSVVMTHRVKEINYDETNKVYTFICHGINADSDQCDGDCTDQTQSIPQSDVLGKVVGDSKFMGGLYNFLMQPYGLIVLILVPGGYLIISSIFDIVKASKKPKEETNSSSGDTISGSDNLNNLSSEDKERLKKELLNEMLDDKKKGDK